MPPLLPQDSDNIFVKNAEPYYSNEDVAILHDIVVLAQELLPSLPERERLPTNALFHAYHSILPGVGIDADHDSRYARVLFKIGGTRGNSSLYEKFEAVLARMGIEIQFEQGSVGNKGDDASTREAVSSQGSQHILGAEPIHSVGGQHQSWYGSGSEIQALDLMHKHHEAESSQRKASSSGSTATSDDLVQRLSTPGRLPFATASISKQSLLDSQVHNIEQEKEKDYGLRAWLNDSLGKRPQETRTVSPSTPASLNGTRGTPQFSKLDLNTARTPKPWPENTTFAGEERRSGTDIEHLSHPGALTQAPDDLSDSRVTLMIKLHMENLFRQVLVRWQNEALRLQEKKVNLEILANGQDRRVLLRQALDSWHDGINKRRRMVQTEVFFAHLGRRADRARDIFLMAKSLTHWSYNATKETQRTSVARRHILRMRYFAAWRETTAVYELKARRQVILKFFLVWQKQHISIFVNKEKAVIHFADNLVQRIFWAWFWAFCDRRAPIWRADRLLGKQMSTWARLTNCWQKEQNAAFNYQSRNLCQKVYLTWFRTARRYTLQRRQAQEFKKLSLFRQTLESWKHGSALFPRMHILYRKIGLRLKTDSLIRWAVRARQENHARVIDRSKIIREAWITWNDKLRCHVLQTKINNRLMLQGLYKWALDERCLLARRVMERRAIHVSLNKWADGLQSSATKESKDSYLARRVYVHRLSSRVVQSWRRCLQNHFKDQNVALEFNRPIALGNIIARWSGQNQRIRQLRTWAFDGDFYFLASKTVRLWKDAAEMVRREKRRIAYGQLRRRYKIRLAREMFSRWHLHANSVTDLDRLAIETSRNKVTVLCMEVFDCWRARVEEVTELNLSQKGLLLKRHFNYWKSMSIARSDFELEAESFFQDRAVMLCLKRWSRVALQLKAAQHLAVQVREKYLKKTSRRMLGHWLRRCSARRRAAGPHDHDESGVQALPGPASSIEFEEDPNADDWLERVNNGTISMPIPYLSTPSRRASRARNLRLSSTTPSAPLSTPVERQLRAQYSGGPLPSLRRRIGGSVFSRSTILQDLEVESRTEEESIEL